MEHWKYAGEGTIKIIDKSVKIKLADKVYGRIITIKFIIWKIGEFKEIES